MKEVLHVQLEEVVYRYKKIRCIYINIYLHVFYL